MKRYIVLLALISMQANVTLPNGMWESFKSNLKSSFKSKMNSVFGYFKFKTAPIKNITPAKKLEEKSQHNIQYVEGQRNYPGRIENLDRKTIEANITETNCFSDYCRSITKVIGYITYGAEDKVKHYTLERRCMIELLEVDEGYRRQGVGSELVKRALNDMKSECRCSNIRLKAMNPASQALFSKLGAQREYSEPSFNGSRHDMYFKKEKECSYLEELWTEFSRKIKK